MRSPALHASQSHSHLSPQWNTQWNSPTSNFHANSESGDRVAWALTALNTDILLKPHAIYSGNKENDQPISDAAPQQQLQKLQQLQQQHAAAAAGNTSSLLKRPHPVSSSPYKSEAAPPLKRASIRGVGNWMSPVGKRKSSSSGGFDAGLHDARKAYKMERAAATTRRDERIFSAAPAAVNIALPKAPAHTPTPAPSAPPAAATNEQVRHIYTTSSTKPGTKISAAWY
jgi:hypothetical protein